MTFLAFLTGAVEGRVLIVLQLGMFAMMAWTVRRILSVSKGKTWQDDFRSEMFAFHFMIMSTLEVFVWVPSYMIFLMSYSQ